MLKFAFIIGLTLSFLNQANAQTIHSERELGYGSPMDVSLPLWVRKMYSDDPNVYEVENMYIEFYKKNQFVKNQHTQYFKRYAQPMVDKFTTTCIKDTFHFADYSAHHKSSATFQWVITPTPIYK